MRKIIFVVLAFISFAAKSQNTLSGTVLDSLTRNPIPFVNVFFANTTIGTVTDTAGNFTIRNFPSGKYDLTVSMIGYNPLMFSVDFSGGEQKITLYLTEQVVQLKEVFVRADTADWKNNFNLFRGYFLGATRNAQKTAITNPKELNLFFDSQERLLVAHARKELTIENRALGYNIYYRLVDFAVDYKQGKIEYFGIPRFELLTPKGNGERRRWDTERKRSYEGSFSHFIQTLKQNKLEQNGFDVYTLFRIPNPDRPSDAVLNERIKYWRERSMTKSGGVVIINSRGVSRDDSLGYYIDLKRLPELIDSVGRKITDTRELFVTGSNDLINYKGLLRVVFKNEHEEVNYSSGRQPLKVQISIVHFLVDQLRIYDNGYYEDVRNVFLEGYMGWSEKLAELLPLEYVPPPD